MTNPFFGGIRGWPILALRAPEGQADFEASDVEDRPVEVAFFDAGHLVEHLGVFRWMDGWEKDVFYMFLYVFIMD